MFLNPNREVRKRYLEEEDVRYYHYMTNYLNSDLSHRHRHRLHKQCLGFAFIGSKIWSLWKWQSLMNSTVDRYICLV